MLLKDNFFSPFLQMVFLGTWYLTSSLASWLTDMAAGR